MAVRAGSAFGPWRRLADLPATVWMTSVTVLLNRMGTMALPFLSLFLTETRHVSESRAGLVVGSYGLAGVCIAPVVGRLCDRVGPARLIVWALLGAGVLMFVVPAAPGYAATIGVVVLWALCAESVRPASGALIAEAVPAADRRRAFTLLRVAINLGMSVGPAVGGFIAAVSYGWVFRIDAVTSWLAALFLASVMGSLPQRIPHQAQPHQRALRDRRVWLYFAAILPGMVVFFQTGATMALFLVRGLRLPPSFYGLMFTLNTALILILEIPLTARTSHWSHRLTFGAGAVCLALGVGGLAVCTGPWSVAATVVVWTFGEMLMLPAAVSYMSDLAPRGRSGEYQGMHSMLVNLAMTLAPVLGTALLEYAGARVLWAAMGGLGLVSAAALVRLPPPNAKVL